MKGLFRISLVVLIAIMANTETALRSAPADKNHVLDTKWHHIRNVEPREWLHHPEKAEASQLVLDFDLADPTKNPLGICITLLK